MIEEITLPVIRTVLNDISSAKNITIDEDTLTFNYRDHDNDDVLIIIAIENDEKIQCTLLMEIPDENYVTSIICTNQYNERSDTHGTFAYATTLGSSHYIALESDILTRGGISEASIKYNLKNFIQHIDPFESILLSAISELGPDNTFLKSSDWTSFWKGANSLFKQYIRHLDDDDDDMDFD